MKIAGAMIGSKATRREVVAGAGAATMAAILPAMAQLTEAQQLARQTLLWRIEQNAMHLASLEAMPQPGADDQAITMLYELCRDQAA